MGKSAVNVTAIFVYLAQKFLLIAFFVCLVFLVLPRHASATEATALLGGGNALVHATTGIQHANPRSSITEHLLFASTRGGKPEVIPPSASSTQATADDQQGDDGGPSGDSGDSNNQDENSQGENGGASGGNGGNGGNAAEGGLVRAGSVVSNANALNVLNTVLIRIRS